tara:strand:- start:847 stop:1083 length:237 start_codon:yes stop_codon:yes gene_type:complete
MEKESNMPEFLKKLNKQLKGLKIVEVSYDGDNFPIISLSDGSGIWVQCDDECNGPGVAVHITTDKDGKQTELGTWQMR